MLRIINLVATAVITIGVTSSANALTNETLMDWLTRGRHDLEIKNAAAGYISGAIAAHARLCRPNFFDLETWTTEDVLDAMRAHYRDYNPEYWAKGKHMEAGGDVIEVVEDALENKGLIPGVIDKKKYDCHTGTEWLYLDWAKPLSP